jgi:hypothetical protein
MQKHTKEFEACGSEAIRGSSWCRPELIASAEQTESWLEDFEELEGLCGPHVYAYAK